PRTRAERNDDEHQCDADPRSSCLVLRSPLILSQTAAHPCILHPSSVTSEMRRGRPHHPGSGKTVAQHGRPVVSPHQNPNSCLGTKPASARLGASGSTKDVGGWMPLQETFVGIDVAKAQ